MRALGPCFVANNQNRKPARMLTTCVRSHPMSLGSARFIVNYICIYAGTQKIHYILCLYSLWFLRRVCGAQQTTTLNSNPNLSAHFHSEKDIRWHALTENPPATACAQISASARARYVDFWCVLCVVCEVETLLRMRSLENMTTEERWNGCNPNLVPLVRTDKYGR